MHNMLIYNQGYIILGTKITISTQHKSKLGHTPNNLHLRWKFTHTKKPGKNLEGWSPIG